MVRKEFRKRVLAGLLATLTAFGAMTGLPAAQQTVHAEETGLPTETNTSFATARELVFGTSTAGTLSESSGRRFYRFSLSEAGRLDMGFERKPKGGYDYLYIYIYDASQTQIYYARMHDLSFTLKPVYLTGGDYYMMVSEARNQTFSFVANLDTAGESFTETQDSNNDMASNASAIDLKKKYKGVLAWNDDIDYFRFQVPAEGKITFNITNAVSDKVQYGIYDASLNPVYTNVVSAGYKDSRLVALKKGTYYLAVAKENVNSGTGSYTFSIDYTKKNTAAPKLKSVKNSGSRSMTVKWSGVSGASGYELWYSKKSNFKSGVEKKELGASETSVTCYGLSKNKKYYVKVRAYELVNGTKVYGKWSGKKAVKIKK